MKADIVVPIKKTCGPWSNFNNFQLGFKRVLVVRCLFLRSQFHRNKTYIVRCIVH
jgi:hypothetical protein